MSSTILGLSAHIQVPAGRHCNRRAARSAGVARAPLAVRATYQAAAPSPVAPSSTINGAPRTLNSQAAGPANPAPGIFASIEKLIQNFFNSTQPGQRGDWKEVEGCYVLYPPAGRAPQAVAHFMGGAFVGAAPQVAYRLFLEALSNRDVLVVATPYNTNFDHLRIADETQFKFDRCVRALGPEVSMLPVYGVGHSLGATIHMLISSRYAVKRAGNVLMSYNNLPATSSIPFLSPFIAPSARVLGPILTAIATSPIRSTVEWALDSVKGFSPMVLRQVIPLVEQLAPIYLDVAQGKQEFLPSPEETRNLVRSYYSINRNLLLRFKDDDLDDTNALVQLLQTSPNVGEVLDLSVRTLPGDHLKPMHQAIVDIPPEVARLANTAVYQSGALIGRMANAANQMGVAQASVPLEELSRGVSGMANIFGGQVGGPVTDSMQSLADEVAAWMGSGAVVVSGSRPVASAYAYNNFANSPLSNLPLTGPVFASNNGVPLANGNNGLYSTNGAPYSGQYNGGTYSGGAYSGSAYGSPSSSGYYQQQQQYSSSFGSGGSSGSTPIQPTF